MFIFVSKAMTLRGLIFDLHRKIAWLDQNKAIGSTYFATGLLFCFSMKEGIRNQRGKFFFITANHSILHPLLVKKYLSHMHSWREFSKNTQPTRILFIPQNLPASCKPLLRRAPPLSAHQHSLAPLIPAG